MLRAGCRPAPPQPTRRRMPTVGTVMPASARLIALTACNAAPPPIVADPRLVELDHISAGAAPRSSASPRCTAAMSMASTSASL